MGDPVLNSVNHRLDVVAAALPEIAATLRSMQSGDLKIQTKSNVVDLVTAADFESERMLLEIIRSSFPDDAILAEESGLSGEGEFVWVIDPLDGTINYSHGLPHYAISIGVMSDGVPVGGLVSLPAFDDTYRATNGEGAFKNGQPIAVTKTAELKQALVVTGFPYEREGLIDPLLAGVREVLLQCQGLRRTGSAAVDLCYVAEGKFDAHFEINLNPWDSCGGSVILREAGGRVTGYDGIEHSPFEKSILSTNGLIHEKLLAILAPMIDKLDV